MAGLFGWVYRAAHERSNHDASSGSGARGMARVASRRADPADPRRHFATVSRRYEPGLFHGSDVAGLPRTSNDREPAFGSRRHYARRATGRKGASPALVIRGPARLVAGLMTRLGEATADDLAPTAVLAWQELRQELGHREVARVQQRRFRCDPPGCLKQLETLARQSGLPA